VRLRLRVVLRVPVEYDGRRMALAWLRSRVALAALAIACLPLGAGGACTGRTACFTYTQGEYAANGNQCPAAKDALPNFTDPKCPGPVVSVDGPGTFDGQICCYPVTYEDITADCGNSGMSQGGSFTSPPITPSTACAKQCAVILTNGMPPCNSMVAALLNPLRSCATMQCSLLCADFINTGKPVDQTCNTCLIQNCPAQLMNCETG
jgi:hypothetical protein